MSGMCGLDLGPAEPRRDNPVQRGGRRVRDLDDVISENLVLHKVSVQLLKAFGGLARLERHVLDVGHVSTLPA